MPGVPQREAILAITLWRHAAEVGATQVDPRLLANQAPGPGEKKPLQLIAGPRYAELSEVLNVRRYNCISGTSQP